MPRVPMNQPEDAEGEVARLYEAVGIMLGRVPHSYRILSNSPLVAKMLLPINAVLQREGAGSVLTTRLKEMVIIKTSRLNACAY